VAWLQQSCVAAKAGTESAGAAETAVHSAGGMLTSSFTAGRLVLLTYSVQKWAGNVQSLGRLTPRSRLLKPS
jgi:hypothetical protein